MESASLTLSRLDHGGVSSNGQKPDLEALAFRTANGPLRNWVAVASAEHARHGRDHSPIGFMQVGHGKGAPLRRLAGGDRVAYYAPATQLGGKDRLQSLVSIGIVQSRAPYTADIGGGFIPWRRDVMYVVAREIPIAPLLDALEWVDDRRHWGAKFRFGLFEISDHDMRCIAQAMEADTELLGL